MTVTLDRATNRAIASTQSFTERTRRLLTLKNLHIAGVVVLGGICVYLLAQMAYAWQETQSRDTSALARQTAAMHAAEIAARPLAGLDEKLKQATVESDRFYERRLPFAYSPVLAELGALAKKQNVKLTRVQYAEAPVLTGGIGPLTELRMDASLSGDYRPLVLFINDVERDKRFFLIGAMALTGQQSGAVGVRLRITTYLRAPVGAEASDKTVTTAATEAAGKQDGGAAR
jgi:type IV pilus assembly protein PilO